MEPLTLLVLVGLAGLTHGLLALAGNVRGYLRTRSNRRLAALLGSVLIGAALASGALFIRYQYDEARIWGFPFPAATTWTKPLPPEFRNAVPQIEARTHFLDPIWNPGQLANMALAFLLPQLILLLVPGSVLGGDIQSEGRANPRTREWYDFLLLVVTGIAIAAYVPITGFVPKAWRELPRFGLVRVQQLGLVVPPIVMTIVWCLASVWIFSGLTRRVRWVWAALLTCALLGLPVTCTLAVFGDTFAPRDIRK